MTSKTVAPGYFMDNGHTNPTTTIRKSFVKGQVWNPSQWSDPEYDKKMAAAYLERDEPKRQSNMKLSANPSAAIANRSECREM